MGVAVSTIEVTGAHRWRDYDWQLTLYLLLLLGFGVVLGVSAAWGSVRRPTAAFRSRSRRSSGRCSASA